MELKDKYNIKCTQFYTALRDRQSLPIEEAKALIKTTAAGEGRNGMTSDVIKYFQKHGLAYVDKKQLHFIEVKNFKKIIATLAEKLAAYKNAHNDIYKIKRKQPKQQDIVQPTLFTESVMREQERPIVTANDQLIQRIEALEARLNKITTLFQNL